MQAPNATEDAGLLMQSFFEDAPIGMAVTGPDGSWRRVNATLAAMLGYSVEELRSTSFLTLTHPDDLAATHDAVRRLVTYESQICELEKRMRAKDGSYVWLCVTTKLQGNVAGAAHQFTSYFSNISERKERERALKASEDRYRSLFEASQEGILIVDTDTGRVVDANPFMTTLTGHAPSDLVGTPLSEMAGLEAGWQALEHVRYEDMPLRTRDGRELAVEFTAHAFLVHERRVLQCNIRDISERKAAAETIHLRDRAIEAVSQGILVSDALRADDPIVYASPGFTRLTGYEPDEVLGRNCRFLQGVGTEEEPLAKVRHALREKKPCTVELLNFKKDGSAFWNSLSLSPVKDADGQVTHFVGVQTDVTERRQLESQLRQSQKMEAIGRLAGGIAHDFNNVLSVILSYAELATGDLRPDEPLRADIDEIGKAALRAADLTKQLLVFSRQQVLDTKVISLDQTLAGMKAMLPRLLGADIELAVLRAPHLGNVKADRGQIEQVIMNLAVNARDAMLQGGRLTLETANVDLDEDFARQHLGVTPGSYVMLAVTDSGAGMNQETLRQIFEPFFTTKEKGKGTGLGLATVFGIVKQSGGHIFVDSERGLGTTFKVFLPRVGAAIDAAPSAPSIVEDEKDSGTILLVEDEDQVRNLVRSTLRRQGYVVLDAANGGEALLICEQHPGAIDLLLTDVVLPRMSGRQLAERLTSARPTMKVLFMSGYTDDAISHHGVVGSAVALLAKPFTPASMTKKVREVLRSPGSR